VENNSFSIEHFRYKNAEDMIFFVDCVMKTKTIENAQNKNSQNLGVITPQHHHHQSNFIYHAFQILPLAFFVYKKLLTF